MTPLLRRTGLRNTALTSLLVSSLAVIGAQGVESPPAGAADDAATVNGTSITVDDLDATIGAFAAQGILQLTVDPTTGTVSADGARTTLTILIQNEVGASVLAGLGVEPMSDDDRDAQFQAIVAQQPALDELDDDAKNVITSYVAQSSQMNDLTVPAVDQLRDRYGAAPASVGVVCARLFTATDEEAAVDAADALGGDASFDAVEAEYAAPTPSTEPVETIAPVSTEPDDGDAVGTDPASGSEPTGSATSEPADPADYNCAPLNSFRSLGAEVVAPLLDAAPGEPVVLETASGWYVLQYGSFDDISGQLQDVYDNPPATATGSPGSAGQLLFEGSLATAEVSVNPRYGRWDPLSGTVVALDA